jgi:uncharacterized protein YndB with AHSA1/START domain/mannose-6-phosphate isomerase-like protein (cupin superfamily)
VRMGDMITTATVLQMPRLGVRVELRRTAADTDGELLEFDVVGRARGFFAVEHVHTAQTEHYEVIEGALRLVLDGTEHLLGPGDEMTTPAGTPHAQLAGGEGEGRIRVTLRPAGRAQEFLERLAAIKFNRWGWPSPVDAAAITRDFGDEGAATRPSPRVQKAISRAVLALASREYLFVDEWDVSAPRENVFAAISDARTYPRWWTPVYIDVEADGDAEVGKVSRQHFKGRLPYHLRTTSTITRLEPSHIVEADVDGDLRGHGKWTLTATADGGTHVRFDWQVFADKPLLRLLTPILRPAFRWNHAWAIARAREGLEPFAR